MRHDLHCTPLPGTYLLIEFMELQKLTMTHLGSNGIERQFQKCIELSKNFSEKQTNKKPGNLKKIKCDKRIECFHVSAFSYV